MSLLVDKSQFYAIACFLALTVFRDSTCELRHAVVMLV